MNKDNAKELREWLKFIALLISAGWVLYVFGFSEYKERVLYRSTATVVSITSNLQLESESTDYYVVRATSKIRTNSKVSLSVFHSPFQVIGYDSSNIDIEDAKYLENIKENYNNIDDFFITNKEFQLRNPVLLVAGKLFSSSFQLEPEEEIVRSFSFLVKKNYEYLFFSVGLNISQDASKLRSKLLSINNDSGCVWALKKYAQNKQNASSSGPEVDNYELITDSNIEKHLDYLKNIKYSIAWSTSDLYLK